MLWLLREVCNWVLKQKLQTISQFLFFLSQKKCSKLVERFLKTEDIFICVLSTSLCWMINILHIS